MFWRKPVYRVVEVERTREPLPEDNANLREGFKTLLGNPYFGIILDRLLIQKQALETRLKQTRFERIEDISFVQNGVYWTGWLANELNRLTQAPPPRELTPTEQEEIAMREIDNLIERVGIAEPATNG